MPAKPVTAPKAACRPAPLASDLRIAVTIVARRLRWERSSEGITDTQYSALASLLNAGPRTPGALAEEQHIQPSPMTRAINALEEAGLVRRAKDPSDGRQVIVEITEAGTAEVRETRRRRNEWLAQRLADLTEEDRAVLARAAVILRQVVE